MTSDLTGNALDVIARHYLADIIAMTSWGDAWEGYPDIGEHDWRRIAEHAEALAPAPEPDEYRQAYAHLAQRAEGAES
jgi:hypothetical protein